MISGLHSAAYLSMYTTSSVGQLLPTKAFYQRDTLAHLSRRAPMILRNAPTTRKWMVKAPERKFLGGMDTGSFSTDLPACLAPWLVSQLYGPWLRVCTTFKRGGGYCWLRYCWLELFDRELFVWFQQEDKLEKLELRNLSSMRVSHRIIPPSEHCVVRGHACANAPAAGFLLDNLASQALGSDSFWRIRWRIIV